jgi:hypothetical protein
MQEINDTPKSELSTKLTPENETEKVKTDNPETDSVKKKGYIPRPGVVVHPDAPQRLNVDGEPIMSQCCG